VPVVSWVALRGRCAHCAAPISAQYPLVEAFAGVVFVGVTWWAEPQWQSLFAAAVTWFLLLGAPRAVVELQRSRRGRRGSASDADLLAGLTRVPGIVWVGAFLAVCVGALLLAGVWLLDL